MPPEAAPFRVICGTSPSTDMLVVNSKHDECEELEEGEVRCDEKREEEKVCVCVCVCVKERDNVSERGRERKRGREEERESKEAWQVKGEIEDSSSSKRVLHEIQKTMREDAIHRENEEDK